MDILALDSSETVSYHCSLDLHKPYQTEQPIKSCKQDSPAKSALCTNPMHMKGKERTSVPTQAARDNMPTLNVQKKEIMH